MAEYSKEHYSKMEDSNMTAGLGAGAGALGGLVIGGLAGYALAENRRGGFNDGGYGVPAAVAGCSYSHADVDNIVATKNAEIDQLKSTTQIIDKIQSTDLGLTKGICQSEYTTLANFKDLNTAVLLGNAQLAGEIKDASAKADLCCCKTQALIEKTACETDAKIAASNQDLKNFYLQDELTKLRFKDYTRDNTEQINIIGSTVNSLANVVAQRLGTAAQ